MYHLKRLSLSDTVESTVFLALLQIANTCILGHVNHRPWVVDVAWWLRTEAVKIVRIKKGSREKERESKDG